MHFSISYLILKEFEAKNINAQYDADRR